MAVVAVVVAPFFAAIIIAMQQAIGISSSGDFVFMRMDRVVVERA